MADLFHLDVVTPERAVLSRKVEEVIAPGSQGEFGVLKGHAAFLTTLKHGQVTVYDEEGKIYMAISGGFAEVTPDRVIILAEEAQIAREIDVVKAQKDLDIAQEKLNNLAKDDPDLDKWEDKRRMAEVRIKVAENAKVN